MNTSTIRKIGLIASVSSLFLLFYAIYLSTQPGVNPLSVILLVFLSMVIPVPFGILYQRMNLRERHLTIGPMGGISFDDYGIYKAYLWNGLQKDYIIYWNQIADVQVLSMWRVPDIKRGPINFGPPYDTEGHLLLRLKDGREMVLYNVVNPELKAEIIRQKITR